MTMYGIGEKALGAFFFLYVLTRFCGTQLSCCVFVIGLSIQIWQWYKAGTVWKRLGVPSPPAIPLIGNLRDYSNKGMHACDVEWMKKYGNVYGNYLFTTPELVVADKEILKQVLVKDFHNFTNRRGFDIGSENSVFRRLVTVLKDDDWKNTRNAITPAFTSGKLKNTVHLMDKCIGTCCDILVERKDETDGVDVKNLISNLTLEIIAAAAFAVETDAQRNPDNEFIKHVQQLSKFSFKDWRLIVTILFPFIVSKLDQYFQIQLMLPGVEEFYVSNLSKVLRERRQCPKVDKLDFLQLLINAADNKDKDDNLEKDSAIDHGLVTATNAKKWALTDFDIIAQSFIFLVAGQETTANTLNFALYLIAVHQEVKDKCFKEIYALTPNGEPITYKHMQHETPYLEAIIVETLRMYPAVLRFDRHCDQDYRINDQLTIPKGTAVCVPVYGIQHSRDNYEEPEKFDPERFLIDDPRNDDPFLWLPFGYGPRNCIGMRFAMLEMKLILSNLIRKFSIEPSASTEPMPLELDFTTSAFKPKTLVRLLFKPRND